mmetsp:Transcript_15737/g.43546  ORF Transcript_15737/g.43546 Transcript_15737/m.43546 type:complete len:229 (-) Transcript_15737:1086-1772(-)
MVSTWVKPTCSQKALSWEMTTMDPLPSPQSDNTSLRASTHSTSRWFETSSSRYRLLGLRANIASATRAFSPPDSCPTIRSALSPRSPNPPSTVRACSSVTYRSPSAPDRACSVTRSTARRFGSSSCARSCVKTPSLRLESSTRSPFSRGRVPRSVCRSVVLPAPFGPRMRIFMPCWMLSSISEMSATASSPDSSSSPSSLLVLVYPTDAPLRRDSKIPSSPTSFPLFP